MPTLLDHPPASSPAPKAARAPRSSALANLANLSAADLQNVAAMAQRAEERLQLWFDLVPQPAIEQLDRAVNVLWRLAAVRKTLYLCANPHLLPKSNRQRLRRDPLLAQINQSLAELEAEISALLPPRPPKSHPKASPTGPAILSDLSAPSAPSAPSFPLVPPVPSIPASPGAGVIRTIPACPDIPALQFAKPPSCAPAAPAPSSVAQPAAIPPAADLSRPVAACPLLKAPLHSAQAALTQADRLCHDSNLPNPPHSTPDQSSSSGYDQSSSSSSSSSMSISSPSSKEENPVGLRDRNRGISLSVISNPQSAIRNPQFPITSALARLYPQYGQLLSGLTPAQRALLEEKVAADIRRENLDDDLSPPI